MRLMPTKTKGLDHAKNAWSDIIEKLNSVTVSIDPDSFLLHYWLSNRYSVSKAKLFLSYKAEIKKSNAKASLDYLKSAASTYVRCMAPTESKFSKEERRLQESLAAIRTFGVAQAAPLMLAIMTQYERKLISLKATKSAFELIEKFTFQFNALTQSRGGGGVSNMYAKLAQSTMASTTPQGFAVVVAEMKEKFRERVPDQSEFTLPFSRLTYRSTYTRDRNLVRYALTKISRHFGMPEEVDVSMLTIEHILPQSKGKETDDEKDVGAIGNLIFANETINGNADDKLFKDKIKLFTQANNVYVDNTLATANDWTSREIAKRGVALAEIGYSSIWKI